jgi:hypothetical protein
MATTFIYKQHLSWSFKNFCVASALPVDIRKQTGEYEEFRH